MIRLNCGTILIALSLLMLLSACNEPSVNYVVRVVPTQLNSDNMYQSDKVKDVLFDAQESNFDSLRVESRQLFLKGIDAIKNKHKVADAIDYFKKSLMVLPDAKTYFELGKAFLAYNGGYQTNHEAAEAFQVAEDLDYSPISEVYYQEAVAANLTKKDGEQGYEVRNFLMRAISSGFSDSTYLQQDERLHSFVTSKLYEEVKMGFISSSIGDVESSKFEIYADCFPRISGSKFEIVPEKSNMEDYNKSISYSFVEFIPEMESSSFGREVSNDFIAVAKLAETPNYTALLYASVSYFGDEIQPVYVKLVTYSKTGELIDGKIFAGQFSAERIKAGTFDGTQFTVREYKRSWQQPIDKVPFSENTVKSIDPVSSAVYVINNNGSIKEESTTGNYKDSIILVNN